MLVSETSDFSLGYDYIFSLRTFFSNMSIMIPLDILTDFKSIFYTITTSKCLRELRLMNVIAGIRSAYRNDEIKNVAWIRSK